MPVRRILVIHGHPDERQDHYAHALARAYADAATAAGHVVEQLTLATMPLRFLRSRDDLETGDVSDDVRRAQAALLGADHLVLFFPIWNGAAPARVRAFFEQTFRPAFTFPDRRPGEPLGVAAYFDQRKALSGKTARIVATMSMPGWLYRLVFRPHAEKTALTMAGIVGVRETAIGNVHRSAAWRSRWLGRMAALGAQGR